MPRLIALAIASGACALSLQAQEKKSPAGGDPATVPALASSETEKLLALEGKTARVTGRIVSTGKSKSGNQFLNFADSKFVAVTFSSDLAKFPEGEPADVFDGKTVAITGPIKIYKGIPEIILSQPSLVEVIDPAGLVVPEPEPAAKEEEKKEEAAVEPDLAPSAAPAPPESTAIKTPPVDWRKYFPE